MGMLHFRWERQFGEPGMPYILRFVQTYEPTAAERFFKLEAEFKDLERRSPHFPQGRRSQLLLEGELTNTLIWEGEFSSLQKLQDALNTIADDPTHTALFREQLPLITEMRTEIYKVLELCLNESTHD
jgi:hypothetical protein